MGVADNKTYRDQYHFTDDFRDTAKDNPSINVDPPINQLIKENPYRSNVEIEGGELILQPDLSAIFKAKGKKHSKGGMDVLLRPNAFVFSDFKELAITENEKELFELKKGGSNLPVKNTPAQIVKKNVDVKHYNTLVNNISDPFKDDLARKSSAMMLEKYIATLGNIAYLQESKKMFPDGLPEFSIGTAPVFDRELKDKIDENKQYMKFGGKVNPYMQDGGQMSQDVLRGMSKEEWKKYLHYFFRRGPLGKKEQQEYRILSEKLNQRTSRKPVTLDFPYKVAIPSIDEIGKKAATFDPVKQNTQPLTGPVNPFDGGFESMLDQVNKQPTSQQQQQQKSPSPRAAGAVNEWDVWRGDKLDTFEKRYGVSNAADKIKSLDDVAQFFGYKGPKDVKSLQEFLYSPENKKIIDKWHNKYNEGPSGGMFDGKVGIRWANAIREIMNGKPTTVPPQKPKDFSIGPRPVPGNTPNVKEPEEQVDPQYGKRVDWQFTPWQKLSHIYNMGKWASARRYMPARAHYTATFAEPSLLNPEQTIGDMKGMASSQMAANNSLSPILRGAQNNQAFGQVLNQIAGVRSQYDNQNSQIQNQFRQFNTQIANNAELVNMNNDYQYRKESIEGRKNFNNLRTFLADQTMNNVMRDVETNQKLAYDLLTQNNPAYDYDWKTGDFVRNQKSILDVENSSQGDYIGSLLQNIDFKALSDSDKIKFIRELQRGKALQYLPQAFGQTPPPFPQKKGGKVKKNPYRY